MEYSVELSARTQSDIESAYKAIAADSPQNARRWRFKLEHKIKLLRIFPERYGLAPEHYYGRVEIR